MTRTQLIISSYSLTYLALALAVNDMPFYSFIIFTIAAAILLRELMTSAVNIRISPLLITGLVQISMLIIGLNSLLETGYGILLSAGMLTIYNILFSYVLSFESPDVRVKTTVFCAVTYVGYAVLVMIADYILKNYIPFVSAAVLPGYWVITLLMGLNLLVCGLMYKPFRTQIIIRTKYTSGLS